jgi:hypothetical protein
LKRALNILLSVSLLITIPLIVSHLEKVVYFIDLETKETETKFKNKDFEVAIFLNKGIDNKLPLSVWFNRIKSDFKVLDLHISVDDTELIEIKPYSGMKPWDIPTYQKFESIPDSIKYLTIESNPYYAFDHIYKAETDKSKYNLKISILITKQGEKEEIRKDVVFARSSKIELRPWDMHSDISFIFIPIFGFISIVLTLIKLSILAKEKIGRNRDL